MSATALLFLQAPPPEGLLLAMALWYALGFLGMLLAWHNYRKRKGGQSSQPGSQSKTGALGSQEREREP